MAFASSGGSVLGSSISTSEIEDNAITLAKLFTNSKIIVDIQKSVNGGSGYSITSASYIDMTTPTAITFSGLNAGKTYSVVALMTGSYQHSGAVGTISNFAIKINGVDGHPVGSSNLSINNLHHISCAGFENGITGVTSIGVCGRAKTGASTLAINGTGSGGIILLAILLET